MTCRDRILSNEYADLVVNFILPEEYEYDRPTDTCRHVINEDLQVYYINRGLIPELRYASSSYSFVPKCYGLMQIQSGTNLNTLSLSDAGILSAHRPPLELTG